MPLAYQDLKNRRYLEPIRNFVESELNIKFLNGDRSFCPFHKDTKDSFRIYIDGKDEVRFHCFGECDGDFSGGPSFSDKEVRLKLLAFLVFGLITRTVDTNAHFLTFRFFNNI